MRRDRINSSIEQLKSLLEKEFQAHDPDAKLEKADILEMTVSFLKQQMRPQAVVTQVDYSEGYSQCWQKTLQFLSVSAPHVEAQLQRPYCVHGALRPVKDGCPASLLRPNNEQTTEKPVPSTRQMVWRPW
ncbi:HES5 factor, partial [Amia calva]|nr:HES5 factor [Amia calva]